MKFFTIPPTQHLDLMEINDNYFCLAPIVLKNPQYAEYFRNKAAQGKHVIMDNGAAEGVTLSIEEYLRAINDVKPTEVVCPDRLMKSEATLLDLGRFKHHLQAQQNLDNSHGKPQVMGVPQGSNPESYLRCYLEMLREPFINVIGISKFAVLAFNKVTRSAHVMENRLEVVRMLERYNLTTKPLHLLGMRNPNEMQWYKDIKSVRSSDSAFTVLAAALDKGILSCEYDIPTPHSYFSYQLNSEKKSLAIQNIKLLNLISKGAH